MTKYRLFLLYFALCFLLSGCFASYINVRKVPIDKTSLASTYAETPDPQSLDPPMGEKLFVSWRVPFGHNPDEMKIKLQVIYRDLSEEEFVYPVHSRIGIVGFDVLGDKFRKTNGFFSYRAMLIDKDGKAIDLFKQRMWTNIITLASDKGEGG